MDLVTRQLGHEPDPQSARFCANLLQPGTRRRRRRVGIPGRGARDRIHRLLADLSAQGKGLIIVSSDLDELLAVCDRILAWNDGRIVGAFDREAESAEWSREAVMAAAFDQHTAARDARR